MMAIYASTKQLDKVKSLFHQTSKSGNYPHTILTKALGNCKKPEDAEQVVRDLLRDPKTTGVDIEVINCLINAWAECLRTDPNAADRAYQVYRWIYDDPICARFQIRPDVVTFTTILNCLARTGRYQRMTDAAQKVEVVLNEMEHRFNAGGVDCKPDSILYNVAIKACLNANDFKRAEYILHQMEHGISTSLPSSLSGSHHNVNIRPDVRSYGMILHCYSQVGTRDAADRAEQIHNRMRSYSQASNNSFLKPNVNTYNMILSGWALSGAPDASDRMWMIYEQMTDVDHIALDMYNYTTLLAFLSKSNKSIDMQRALKVLQVMQTIAYRPEHLGIKPDGRHYGLVLQGFVALGDIDSAAQVMNMFVDSYVAGRCRRTDIPDRKVFNWIVSAWVHRNELILATWFILDTITAKSNMNVVSPIGPDYSTVMDLREAWTASQHPEKDKYLSKIDSQVLPTLLDST
jgi:pentatricopeptide repeat protein